MENTPFFSQEPCESILKVGGLGFGSWLKRLELLVKIIYLYSILIPKINTYTHVNAPLFLAGIVLFFLLV